MDEKSPLLNAVSTNSIEPGLLLPPVNPSSTEKSLYFHAYLSQLFAVFSRCFSKCAMVHCQSSYLILRKYCYLALLCFCVLCKFNKDTNVFTGSAVGAASFGTGLFFYSRHNAVNETLYWSHKGISFTNGKRKS
jgi:hypothetical protein